jgi:hypothetical protein
MQLADTQTNNSVSSFHRNTRIIMKAANLWLKQLAALDVLFQNGADKALYVASLVSQPLEFRESSGCDIVHEGSLAGCFRLCRDASGVYMMIGAIFREREGEKADFVVTSRQVGRKFAAEQFSVATCDENPHPASKQTIHKEMPSVNVLNFVEIKIKIIIEFR